MPKHTQHNIVPKNIPIIIAVTGTPGTGKTFISKKISLLMKGTYIDLNKLAIKAGLRSGKDAKRGSIMINENGLYKALKPLSGPGKVLIADSHLSHYLPSSKVSLCIVARCPLKTLQRRLKSRGYSTRKIAENLEAEAMGICLSEAQENGHKILEIGKINNKILQKIAKSFTKSRFGVGSH